MEGKTLLIVAVVLGIGSSSSSDVEFCTDPINIPDFYFNANYSADDNHVVETVFGDAFNFSVSPRCNCNSTVTAIQYCYRDINVLNNNSMESVFEFIVRDDSPSTEITVQSALTGSTCNCQQNMRCDCCDTFKVFPEHHFQIPLTFSVRTANTNKRLLMISSSAVNAIPVPEGSAVSTPDILLLRILTREYNYII